MRISTITIIALCMLFTSCHRTSPNISKIYNETLRYFPIQKGYTWSYIMTSIQENTSLLIKTEVEEINGSEVKINSNGSIFYYIIKEDGIMKRSAGYYILKHPIQKGQYWEFKNSQLEGKINIADIIESIRVRERVYKNCIITEEIIKGQNVLLKTYYAYDVGPVLIEQYTIDGTNEILILKAELLGYSFDPTIIDQTE